jgi:hypothetical protein
MYSSRDVLWSRMTLQRAMSTEVLVRGLDLKLQSIMTVTDNAWNTIEQEKRYLRGNSGALAPPSTASSQRLRSSSIALAYSLLVQDFAGHSKHVSIPIILPYHPPRKYLATTEGCGGDRSAPNSSPSPAPLPAGLLPKILNTVPSGSPLFLSTQGWGL